MKETLITIALVAVILLLVVLADRRLKPQLLREEVQTVPPSSFREAPAPEPLSGRDLTPGQVLKTPQPPREEAQTVPPPSLREAPAPKPLGSAPTHTVKDGEDLYTVAVRFGVSPSDLKQLNNLAGRDLTPGQVLKIPQLSREEAQTVPPSSLREAPAPKPLGSGSTHTVKDGEDLYTVAVRFGVSPSDLKQLNNLASPDLTPGQVLKIPKVEK